MGLLEGRALEPFIGVEADAFNFLPGELLFFETTTLAVFITLLAAALPPLLTVFLACLESRAACFSFSL